MVGATIGATTDTTTSSTLLMSLSLETETNTATPSSKDSVKSPAMAFHPFAPGQCLFCSKLFPDFSDSVLHMQKSHGLFVPHKPHLVVDLETLFRYLHLVIFEYRECIQCGTQRATVQAVQQHMTGKGHCRFDISTQDSEFADFYDFSKLKQDDESELESGGETKYDETTASSSLKPLVADEDSVRLPSGRIISKRSSACAEPSLTRLRLRARISTASRLEDSPTTTYNMENSGPDSRDVRELSKREKRERAIATYQSTNTSKNDRNSLAHLSASQQHSLLAMQLRQAEKVQKQERRRQGRIDRKGNKNLYAYWATETPVYLCG